MTERERKERFDQLDAGRALGDLSPEEAVEWESLAELYRFSPPEKASFDTLVASLEREFSPETTLPEDVATKLRDSARAFSGGDSPEPEAVITPGSPLWKRPALGWAVAACLALMLGLLALRQSPSEDPTDLARQVEQDSNAIRLTFFDTDGGVVGGVVWSDSLQEGFMNLHSVRPNSPMQSQYQLWIVDSKRDDTHPVDGGVFDIADSGRESIIPIDAKLRVDNPGAFVITEEQPGGVVVSKQDRVIAVAQL